MSKKDSAVILFSEKNTWSFLGRILQRSKDISMILEKLSDHYMFQTKPAICQLKLCDDCRVADVVQDKEMMGTSKFSQH